MKKFLKLSAAATAVIMAVSGCSFGKSDNSASTDDFKDSVSAKYVDDIYSQVLTSATIVDNSEAYDVYMAGCEAMENTDSITIVSDMYIGMGTEADTSEALIGTQGEAAEDFSSASSSLVEIKRQKVEDDMELSLKMINTYDNEAQPQVDGYFTDGYLYFVSDDTKIKEAMSYEDLMGMIGNYAYSIEESMIAEASVVAEDEDAIYYFDLDDYQMGQMMENNLTSSGIEFEEGDYVETNYASMSIRVNKDGVLTAFKIGIKATIHDSYGDTPVMYNIDSVFSNINDTTVDVAEDLDSYMDADEYMEKMQQENIEQAEEGTEAESVTIN